MKETVLIIASITSAILLNAQDCYTLTWSDEFNGTELDRSKWNVEIGNGYPDLVGWGNNEVQYYSDRKENLEVSNGSLKITARNDGFGGYDYSSAKIRSKGTFDFKYGRIEAKIKLPSGAGLWPAFWMLPTHEVYGTWPRSGEIDIMENFGQNNYMASTIHYRTNDGQNVWNDQSYGVTLNEDHIFSAVWEEDHIAFYLDWNWIGDENPSDLNGNWPFNEEFYLILNMALGGSAGNVATNFPKTMEVDYIRVYQKVDNIHVTGPDVLFENETSTYNLPANSTATYNWVVPSGASIISGQGTNEVVVKWGDKSGDLICNTTNWSGDVQGTVTNCGSGEHRKQITVESGNCDIHWLDFDKEQKIIPHTSDGEGGIETMYETNPNKDIQDNSDFVGRYGRAGNELFDVLKMNFTEPIDATDLRTKVNTFKMDVYSTVTGTIPVTVEFVNRAKNTGYPKGIHSQYNATITQANTWQTLTFEYVNTADWSIKGDEVNGINILFNPNSNTANIYYFDNLRTTLPLVGKIEGPTQITENGSGNTNAYTGPEMPAATYAWNAGNKGTISSGESSQTVSIYFDNGIYTNTISVELTNSMSCQYNYELKVDVDSPTGLNDELLEQLEVFPNPTNNKLTLRTNADNNINYQLLSPSGIILKDGVIEKSEELDMQNFQTGLYILLLKKENKTGSFKIIKK